MCKTFVGCAAGVRIWTCAVATGEWLEGKVWWHPGLRTLVVYLPIQARTEGGTERDENPQTPHVFDGYSTRHSPSIGFFQHWAPQNSCWHPTCSRLFWGFTDLACDSLCQNQGPPQQIPRRSVRLSIEWLCLCIWRNLTPLARTLMILSGSTGSFAHAWYWRPFCIGTVIRVVTSNENKGIEVSWYTYVHIYIYTYMLICIYIYWYIYLFLTGRCNWVRSDHFPYQMMNKWTIGLGVEHYPAHIAHLYV